MAYNLECAIRLLNRAPHHKGKVHSQFHPSNGEFTIHNNFRGQHTVICKGGEKKCIEAVRGLIDKGV
ncbi:hypothetical protein NVP1244A_134 [Vibrio phage 1.244.A._10N.261.54.C3]|nr:hypothetical protein NVP1244A_134 [Vibrio phage 1.244.A._10N.261.54.C3]AUR98762.1 hypothetical protein NVP1255O_134 [Vibrio phage 1.255.O._10N.286.45.F1]